jgi:hypothetical protein
MLAHKSINDLIEKGRGIAGKEFDGTGFLSWKSHALGYLASHFGPHHAYLQYFESFVRTPERMNILAGAGILEAAKEQMLLDPTSNRGVRILDLSKRSPRHSRGVIP